MQADPFSGAVYVFRAKRADRVKLIYWDGTGVCLFAKRLEDGKFRWPSVQDGVIRLSAAEFSALLDERSAVPVCVGTMQTAEATIPRRGIPCRKRRARKTTPRMRSPAPQKDQASVRARCLNLSGSLPIKRISAQRWRTLDFSSSPSASRSGQDFLRRSNDPTKAQRLSSSQRTPPHWGRRSQPKILSLWPVRLPTSRLREFSTEFAIGWSWLGFLSGAFSGFVGPTPWPRRPRTSVLILSN
jgi:transposase